MNKTLKIILLILIVFLINYSCKKIKENFANQKSLKKSLIKNIFKSLETIKNIKKKSKTKGKKTKRQSSKNIEKKTPLQLPVLTYKQMKKIQNPKIGMMIYKVPEEMEHIYPLDVTENGVFVYIGRKEWQSVHTNVKIIRI